MSLGKRLIKVGLPACTTDSVDPFGDSSGVALYSLDFDASTAPDGTDYSGTPTNVEFGVGGQINYGARFNGSSSKIELPSALSDGVTTVATCISFWFNVGAEVTSSTTGNDIMQFAGTSSLTGKIALGSTSGHMSGETFSVTSNVVGTYTYSQTNIPAGWNHAVVQWNSSDVKWDIYINAVKHTTYTVGTQAQRKFKLKFGNRSTNYYTGSLDQVRIFNRALDETTNGEISALYAETACVYTCTTDTVDFPTTNLAYYKLDNSATDETGSYDGTETNVSYEFGRFGQAAVFNGSSSYIDTGISGATLGELFSVSVWFKTSTTSTFQTIFDNGGNTSGSTGFAIIIGTDNILKATFTNSGGGGGVDVFSLSTGATVTDGNWHHCVLTYNDESAKIYLDNNTPSTGTNTEPFTQAANALRIGAYYASGTSLNFNGDLDQIRVFTSELDSTQVTQLYEEKPCEDTSNFKTVLYEGTGSTQYISNVGIDLETDGGLVWVKKRDGVHDHKLADSVRGATKIIESSTTDAEITATGSINAFNANGFEVGSDSSVNGNGNDFVAWVWKGGGDAVSNTDGDITSQVSANTDAGFSIVKYTGNGGTTQSVGHGLSSAPELVIIKRTSGVEDWFVLYDTVNTPPNYVKLNTTVQGGTAAGVFPSPTTSTVVNIGNNLGVNGGSSTYISYCFHSVSGYSKIGSYTGAGSGTRVYTTSDGTSTGTGGFKPSWIMLKNASVGGTNYDWYIYDVRRNDNDGDDNIESYLRANLSSAEVTSNTGSNGIVMEDDGFTLDIAATSINGTGNTFIYMAFK